MLIRDPCGITCIIITYLAVLYADYVVIRWVIYETMQDSVWGYVHVVGFNLVASLLGAAHLRAALSDPGRVPLPDIRLDFSECPVDKGEADWTVCARCESWRPPRAHHCRVCGRCVLKMDHHCPWINNCVGERNRRHFLLYLLYCALLALYGSCLVLVGGSATSPHCVALLVECLLFGMFAAAVLVEQLRGLPLDVELPPTLCGRRHVLLWLLPCSRNVPRLLVHHHV